MKPDAVDHVAETLRRVRGRITPDERQRFTTEVESLRRLQHSVLAEREMLLDDASAAAVEQLALRIALFYQRLGTLEDAVARLTRRSGSR